MSFPPALAPAFAGPSPTATAACTARPAPGPCPVTPPEPAPFIAKSAAEEEQEQLWGLDTFAGAGPCDQDAAPEPFAEPPALTECLRRYRAGIISVCQVLRNVHDVIHAHHQNWRVGRHCVEQLMRCTHRSTGDLLCPSATEIGMVLTAMARVNRATEALDLLHALETFGPPHHRFPSDENYTNVMAACVNAGRPQDALLLFDRVVPPAGTCRPNFAMLELAMAACLKEKRADRALALFDRHVSEGATRPDLLPRLTTYSNAMAACRRAGRPLDALRLLDHLLRHGAAHGLHPNFLVCNTVVSACVEAGMHAYAQQLLIWATGTGILRHALGLNPLTRVLDLHAGGIAGPQAGYYGKAGAGKGVSVGMAQAIFAFHLAAGTIGPDVRIVVGQHGQHLLKRAMIRCIWEAGRYPASPQTAPGRFLQGCLETRPQPPFDWQGPPPRGPWSGAGEAQLPV